MSGQRKKRKARRARELAHYDSHNNAKEDDHYAGVFKVVMQKGGFVVKADLNYHQAHELWKQTPGTIFLYQ